MNSDSPFSLSRNTTMLTSWAEKLLPQSFSTARMLPASTASKLHGSPLEQTHHTHIRPLLNAMDQLRAVLKHEDRIELPSIVVVADQSGGKSSILESLSGIGLPRGENITTRCPLVLRMVNLSDSSAAAYAVLRALVGDHQQEEHISDLSTIASRIEHFTAQVAGADAAIVYTPLYLTVHRPQCPELTLIDLPGLTRNPVGKQPKDIYQRVRQLILKYIEPKNTIILSVMPANVDFSTCECIALAKQVDPQGARTIAVITKMDLATDLPSMRRKLELLSEQFHLNLGVIAVRNVSHTESTGTEKARELEQQFFAQYPDLLAGSPTSYHLGVTALAQVLTDVQGQCIRASLPQIRMQLHEQLELQRKQLQQLPGALVSITDVRLRIEQLLSAFIQGVAAASNGEHTVTSSSPQVRQRARSDNDDDENKASSNTHEDDERLEREQEQWNLAPRLWERFQNFQHRLTQQCVQCHPFDVQYSTRVAHAIRESAGVCLPNYVSHNVLRSLVQREIRQMQPHAVQLAHECRQLLQTILAHQLDHYVLLYGASQLKPRLMQWIEQYLQLKLTLTLQRIDELFISEQEVFTLNPTYLSIVQLLKAQAAQILHPPTLTPIATNTAAPTATIPVPHAFLHSGMRQQLLSSSGAGTPSATASKDPAASVRVVIHDTELVLTPVQIRAFQSYHTAPTPVLDMQIDCFSYLQVAHRRVCDNVTLCIRSHMVRTLCDFSQGLFAHLEREVRHVNDKLLLEYMQQDRHLLQQRTNLEQSVPRLQQACEIVDTL